MFNYVPVLEKNPNGIIATKNGEKIATRVFQYLFSNGKKVYFCTSSEKPVYAQLQVDPNVSFCTYAPNYAPVLSINGKAIFVEDAALKKRALDENPGIAKIYQSPENPVLQLFYIDAEEVETFDFAEGPKTYTF